MSAAAFLSVWLIHLLAAISPGPSFVVSLRVSASQGFGAAAALAFGFGIGALIWAVAALAGLALLFETVPQLFVALKWVGGAFLVFIGLMMWKHSTDAMPSAQDINVQSKASAFRLGLTTFMTNPKTSVFFGAVFAGLIPPEAPIWALACVVAIIFLNETIWYLLVARVFSLPAPRAAYTKAKTWVDRSFGTLIALFGAKIALS